MSNDQEWQPNYDENRVPAYTLPDPLRFADGRPLVAPADWPCRRRELFELFATQVYGRMPEAKGDLRFELLDEDPAALDGAALRRQVRIHFSAEPNGLCMDLLLYAPAAAARPVPAFLGLNFRGNHSIHADPGIRLSERWMMADETCAIRDHRATEASRGRKASRWPVEKILARGFALATVYCGDIDPDYDDGFQNGVHPLFYKPGQRRPAADEWGTISAWAWGLRRALDYLEDDPAVAADRVAVVGHSRLGKTALWAGAADPRFAMVISNDSGCGGAALSRRCFGETVWRINSAMPHWFCRNFHRYNNAEASLPVDQHMLIALAAPRPVYVASASEDLWADPLGEFLAARHATPVYRLLGLEGLPTQSFPPVNRPVMGTIGYHLRAGRHDITDFDWDNYLDFAEKHFRAVVREAR